MLTPPASVGFDFFGFEIRYYGIVLAVSMLFALAVSYFISKKYYKDVNTDVLLDVFPVLIFSGLIGARLYYVLLSMDYYIVAPQEILRLWHGGMSIHGALIGGFVGGVIYCKLKKLPILKYADILSYGIILAQALGRWGNFFNSEAFGLPTQLQLLYVAPKFRPIEFLHNQYFHPTFLYESILDILIFLILFFIIRRVAKKDGTIFFSYLLLYSVARLFVEALRLDSVLNLGNIPIAQVASILIILASSIALFALCRAPKRV